MSLRKPFILILSSIFLISGCNLSRGQKTELPANNLQIQATIDAAVALTATAGAQINTQIQEGISATLTAMPPLPSPTPFDSAEMTQEEAAQSVDSSVEEAEQASAACSSAVDEVSADGEITAEEIEYVYYYAYYAEEEIAEALALTEEYLDLYYELAEETLAVLQSIESELSGMSEEISALTDTIAEIDQALENGSDQVQASVEQLQSQAQALEEKVTAADNLSTDWYSTVQGELESRVTDLSNLQPDQSASNLQEALGMTGQFVEQVRTSFQDGRMSMEELNRIAQLGANASAGLQTFGNPELQALAGKITGITSQFASGDFPGGKANFSGFEKSLPSLPSIPNLPRP